MDMFPTTLGAMGVNIEGNRLGIGTNLFSDSKTLAEEMGIDKLNTELKKNSAYYYQYIRKNEDKEKKQTCICKSILLIYFYCFCNTIFIF